MNTRPALDQQITFLYAEDAPACWDFYEHVLELPLIQDQGRVRIYGVAGGRAFLGICMAVAPRVNADPRAEGGVCFSFVTPDVDGWHAFLRDKGVAIAQAPQYSEQWRIYQFFLRDPAGHLLEFQRFERDWPAVP